ncbi:MAG: hypothetical protein J6U54_24275 [Clostridiales bacterium]|nr:hypothetical protein [Clostridiales bacterium]
MKNQIADTLISEVEDLGLDDDDMRRMAHSGDIIETIYKNYSRNSFDISDEACRRAIISTLGVYN